VLDLHDFELDRNTEHPAVPVRRSHRGVWAIVVVVVLALGGGLAYYLLRERATPPAPVTATVPPRPIEPPQAQTPAVKAQDIDLPPLPQTDPVVRELVTRLSSHPTVAAWLTTKGLIANFTVVTLNISEGRTPAAFLRPLAPRGRFRTTGSGTALFLDPRSYERYNPYADAITALDSTGTASLYLTLKPRIDDAYRELGYPQGDFDRVLERALGVLLSTPEVDGRVALSPKVMSYGYSDPKLESLPAAQKQFLRMGPQNVSKVRAKLEEIAMLLNLKPI
jgi:hypothetical protein